MKRWREKHIHKPGGYICPEMFWEKLNLYARQISKVLYCLEIQSCKTRMAIFKSDNQKSHAIQINRIMLQSTNSRKHKLWIYGTKTLTLLNVFTKLKETWAKYWSKSKAIYGKNISKDKFFKEPNKNSEAKKYKLNENSTIGIHQQTWAGEDEQSANVKT